MPSGTIRTEKAFRHATSKGRPGAELGSGRSDPRRLIADGPVIGPEVRVALPDGRTRTLRARGLGSTDSAGRTTKTLGISQDATERRAEEERLRNSEALQAETERFASLGSWELDVRTGKAVCSEQLFRLLGLVRSDTAKEDAYWENLQADDRATAREALAKAIARYEPCEYVARYRLPTGAWRIHRTRALPIRGEEGKIVRVIGIVQDITDQTRTEEELHRLSQRLMRARDEERRHMARELHESAGQSLAALKMTLANLRETLPEENSPAVTLFEECSKLAEEAIREVRTVSYLMHPPMLDEAGLTSAIRWYARGFSERSKIRVDVDIPEGFGRLSQDVELTLFRIVQEALTNVHRYSGSRVAKIRLTRISGYVEAEVEDEGCGLARPAPSDGREWVGVGIAGMRERAQQLKGIFEIESAPGRGTIVRALIPYGEVAKDTGYGIPSIQSPNQRSGCEPRRGAVR